QQDARACAKGGVIHDEAGGSQSDAAVDPVQDDRGASPPIEAIAPPEDAGAENDRDPDRADRHLVRAEALVEPLGVSERRVTLLELEQRLAEPQADRAIHG